MSFLPKIGRYFVLGTALLLPWQPLMMIAKPNNLSEEALLTKIFMRHMQGPSSHALGKAAMGKMADFNKNAIITPIERRELHLDELAKKLDKTITSFGSVALAQSLQPIADIALIQQHQVWAKTMLEDDKLYADMQRYLKRIKKSEDAILKYWDATQRENGAKLFARAEGYYYALLQILLGDKINDNKLMLELAMVQKMAGIVWDVVYYFGGQKLWWDAMEHQFNNKDLDPLDSIVSGMKAPFKFFLPWQSDLTTKVKLGNMDDPLSCLSCKRPLHERVGVSEEFFGPSTFGDVKYFISRGINSTSKVKFGKIGQAAWWVGNQGSQKINDYIKQPISNVGNLFVQNCVPSVVKNGVQQGANTIAHYTPGFIKNIGIPNAIKENIGHLEQDGSWVTQTSALDPDQLKGFAWLRNQTYGFVGAAVVSILKGRFFWYGIQSTYHSTRNAIKTMKELHLHTMHLARTIATIKEVAQRLEQHPAFGPSCYMVKNVNNVITKASAELKQLLELLEKDTFAITPENAETHIFSRGNVFLAHRLMTKVRDEIVPLLHSIGEIDALCSMVKNIQESTPQMPFSFVEFISNTQATIEIQKGWLPLVRNAVPNTITLGGGNVPNKMVITGPNGGGKSVFLKLLGTTVAMAQSVWGIVPGEKVRMTALNGLRSCIHPEESLEHELSTFMAEKMRVDAIKNFVFTNSHDPQFKVMLLLDEPFRGTVDAESADRIYDFGKEMAVLSHAIVVIATHVEKPIQLASDTNGAFTNYHVRISELPDNQFKREFELEPGILKWWFTDAQKRSRFIDFVTMEKHKEQLAKMAAEQTAAAA